MNNSHLHFIPFGTLELFDQLPRKLHLFFREPTIVFRPVALPSYQIMQSPISPPAPHFTPDHLVNPEILFTFDGNRCWGRLFALERVFITWLELCDGYDRVYIPVFW
jgi:hypothetical protein